VKAVADEMEVTPSYLYSILSEVSADSYAHFRALFRAVSRVDPNRAMLWLMPLQDIHGRATTRRTPAQLCPEQALGEVTRELVDVVNAHLARKPKGEQKREIIEAVAALWKQYAAVDAAEGE
jgi:hypothetical protein